MTWRAVTRRDVSKRKKPKFHGQVMFRFGDMKLCVIMETIN